MVLTVWTVAAPVQVLAVWAMVAARENRSVWFPHDGRAVEIHEIPSVEKVSLVCQVGRSEVGPLLRDRFISQHGGGQHQQQRGNTPIGGVSLVDVQSGERWAGTTTSAGKRKAAGKKK